MEASEDSRSEGRKYGVQDEDSKPGVCYGRAREAIDNDGRNQCKAKARPECINPRAQRFIASRPLRSVPSSHYLEREIDQNNDGKVFSLKPLVDELQSRRSVIGSKTEFGDQMDCNQ